MSMKLMKEMASSFAQIIAAEIDPLSERLDQLDTQLRELRNDPSADPYKRIAHRAGRDLEEVLDELEFGNPDPGLKDTLEYRRYVKFFRDNGMEGAAERFDRTSKDFLSGPVFKAGQQDKNDPYKFVMSTETLDRQGDVIKQSGWNLREFRRNPIALYQHDSGMPIGTWKNVRVTDGKLIGELVMAKTGTSDKIDEIRALLEQRVLRTVSVGFSPDKYEPLDPEDKWGGVKFLKQTLLETSVVSVPANSEALVQQGGSK